MHHRLLIATQVITKFGVLLQRLANASHVAVTENPETAREKRLLLPVPFCVLVDQELNDACAIVSLIGSIGPLLS